MVHSRWIFFSQPALELPLRPVNSPLHNLVPVNMPNPFDTKAKKSLTVNGKEYSYYSLPALEDARLSTFDMHTHSHFRAPGLSPLHLALSTSYLCCTASITSLHTIRWIFDAWCTTEDAFYGN